MQKVTARRRARLASVGIAIEGDTQYSSDSRNKTYGRKPRHNQPQPIQPKDTATMSTQTQTEPVKHSKHSDTAHENSELHNIDINNLKGEELFAAHVARISMQTDQMHKRMVEEERPVHQVQKGAITFGLVFAGVVAAEVFMGWLFSSKVAPVPVEVSPITAVKK